MPSGGYQLVFITGCMPTSVSLFVSFEAGFIHSADILRLWDILFATDDGLILASYFAESFKSFSISPTFA
jgi:hypothetical protein